MFKKISIFVILLSFSACQSTSKNKGLETVEEVQIEDRSSDANKYQPIENEQQAEELNKQIQEVEVQDRILFSYDSFDVSEEAKKILDTQVEWLKSDTSIKVTIEGHADERGTREYNIALGEKRANSTKNYLTSHGIDASRIGVISYGKERPAFFGSSDEAMAKNRRAVVVVN